MHPDKKKHEDSFYSLQSVEPGDEPEYVGAPTEYADAEEVPEAVSLLAKIFAGGFIGGGLLLGLIAAGVVGCAVFTLLLFAVT